MSIDPREKLCLALDVPTLGEARGIVTELAGYVGIFKVGMQLFASEGPRAVTMIHNHGGKVFLDLKFHDIPNTLAGAGRAAVQLGVEIFNVHAGGGRAMMNAVSRAVAEEAERKGASRPKVLAVTVLTSLSTEDLRRDLNIEKTAEEQVVHLSRLAQDAGLDGVVASPHEIEPIRKACGSNFIILTPGIRPSWAAEGDQKRLATPKEAIQAGADYIVVGRPILHSEDRTEACRKITKEIGEGLSMRGE